VATTVVHGDSAYVADEAGRPWKRLARATGAILGSVDTASPPAFDGDVGFFLAFTAPSGPTTLSAVSQSTGAVLWSTVGDGTFDTPPVTVDGKVLVGSASGRVTALDQATGAVLWSADPGTPLGPGIGPLPSSLTSLTVADGLLLVPAANALVAYGT
jgi:outer membrane protein assembly factor BamB